MSIEIVMLDASSGRGYLGDSVGIGGDGGEEVVREWRNGEGSHILVGNKC